MTENEQTESTEAQAPATETTEAPATTATAEAPPATEPKPKPAPKPAGKAPDGHWWWGVGRRKAAVARVRVRPGNGTFMVNKRPFDKFFTEERDHKDLLNVLEKTSTQKSVDVHVNVRGGGYTGQAGAIVLGLGRALMKFDPSLEQTLRDNNFLTRDPRKVERKKYGQPGARKRFQFSKR